MQEFSEPRWLRLLTNMTGIRSNALHESGGLRNAQRGPNVGVNHRRLRKCRSVRLPLRHLCRGISGPIVVVPVQGRNSINVQLARTTQPL